MTIAPPPSAWDADVVLRDGSVARVRPVESGDRERLRQFHDSLSDETLYLRYFYVPDSVSDLDIDQILAADHQRRVALVATLAGEIIAVGRYEGVSDVEAEIAFTVHDGHQSRGLGSVLLEHLAAIARENGFQRFVAEVMPDNTRMVEVFTAAGYAADQREDDGVVRLTMDLTPTADSHRVREAREHRAESNSMARLLRPRSVAIVGASPREGSFGHTLLHNVIDAGFAGRIQVVHPTAESILGIPACASVAELDGDIDLALVAVNAESVTRVVSGLADKGVHGVIVISSGFAEAGELGVERQRELLRTTRGRGMRLVGPNCLGVLNTDLDVRLNASLAPHMPPVGRIGFFSQSGALGIALLERVRRRGLGVSTFIGAGNRADVSGNDAVQYWDDDDQTDLIMLYLESIGNPRKFTRLARRVARRKPIVAMKTGGSVQGRPLGQQVRHSTLPPAAVDALFTQSGVVRTETLNHLFDVSQVLAYQPLPRGSRLAIVGNSDALAVLAVDAAERRGLQVLGEPVNLGTDATAREFSLALAGLLEDPAVDSVLVIFVPPLSAAGLGAVDVIAAAASRSTKPIVATVVGDQAELDSLLRLDEHGVPTHGSVPAFDSVEEATRALASVTEYAQWRARDPGVVPELEAVDRDTAADLVERWLSVDPDGVALQREQVATLLACYGIALVPRELVGSEDQAEAAAQELGMPVALRIAAPALVRRADLGTQYLNLETAAQVRSAFRRLTSRFPEAGDLVLHPMAPPGVACVIDSVEDPLFGPVVSLGVSGVSSELLGDRAYAVPPVTDVDARALVRGPRAAALYLGEHQTPAGDIEALEGLVLRVAALADDLPEVAELRLEPVIVADEGVHVLGASIRIAPAPGRTETFVRRLIDG